MAAEGLIEAVRTEQVGNLPARTVYAITSEGRRELLALRAEAFRQASLRPDPVDLAVAMSGELPEEELRALVEDRRRALAAQLQVFQHERERTWAEQTVADSLILQHAIGRLEAEIRLARRSCSTPSRSWRGHAASRPDHPRPRARPGTSGHPPVRRSGCAGVPSGDRLRRGPGAAGHGPDGHLAPGRLLAAPRRGPARVLLQPGRRRGT